MHQKGKKDYFISLFYFIYYLSDYYLISWIYTTSLRQNDLHTGDANLHTGDANLHTGDANLHTGDANLHTGDANLHTGDANLHTGDANLHTGDANLHTGDANLHTGDANLHTGDANLHTGDANLHTGDANLHTGDANLHTGDANLHTGDANLHTGDANLHTGDANLHTGDANLHTGDVSSSDVRQVQNRGQAKITKFQYKWCYPSESISPCKPNHPFMTTPIAILSMYRQKLNTYSKMVKNPRFCFAHSDSCEGYYTVILPMVWKDYINEFYTRLLNYKWARGSYWLLKCVL